MNLFTLLLQLFYKNNQKRRNRIKVVETQVHLSDISEDLAVRS
ncbi:hypothetical protein BSUBE1_0981 [Bacillus subtilis E1]|nr:hypothetical protein BSSX_1277 [Bacillus subtilis]KZD76809.1 hypothetical protein B4417_4065 [Bacillus subtilis]CCU57612.1 hypothetical protein BSUBE1_0981 [Bacillus subtilis E1]